VVDYEHRPWLTLRFRNKAQWRNARKVARSYGLTLSETMRRLFDEAHARLGAEKACIPQMLTWPPEEADTPEGSVPSDADQ